MHFWTPSVIFFMIFFLCAHILCCNRCVLGAHQTNPSLCQPWSSTGPACKHLERLDLRFMLDVAEENYNSSDSSNVIKTAVYRFAPDIDKLQLFSLNNAPFLATSTKSSSGSTTYSLSGDHSKKYLSVYGFGNSNNVLTPENGFSEASVLMAERDSVLCGGNGTVAIVSMLMLDVGLHKGLFNYEGDAKSMQAPSRRAQSVISHQEEGEYLSHANMSFQVTTEVDRNRVENPRAQVFLTAAKSIAVKRPLKTGFVPTCSITKNDNKCLYDKDQICIGDWGRANCARCYKDALEVRSAKLYVAVSYYGTDSSGRTLISGTENPLNFHAFGGGNIFKDISKAV